MEIRFPLLLDGATGTEIQKRGYDGKGSADAWVLEHPEAMIELQRGYVEAGSLSEKELAPLVEKYGLVI